VAFALKAGSMAQKLESMENVFKGRRFEREIIVLCVRWYLALQTEPA
jgi:hypothetical protein